MRTYNSLLSPGARSPADASRSMVLGRLGSELALIYHDTLQSPLPEGLRRLVERLDRQVDERWGDRDGAMRRR